jgi:hypothetical protein
VPQTTYYYRLHIRNADDDGDLLVLSSKPGDANTLLCEAPEGDGQAIDPIMGTLEMGAYTWQAADRYDGDDVYTITSLIADEDARNQLLSHKCIGRYSTDGSLWNEMHTGYLNDLKLSDAATYTFIVGDTDRRERDAVLFRTITDEFNKVSNFIGGPVEAETPVAYQGTPTRAWGPIIDYGPARMVVIANPSGLVNPTTRVTLSLTGANLPPRYLGFQSVYNGKIPNPAEYIDQLAYQYFEWDATGRYKTDSSQRSQPWGSFPQLEVKLKAVSGGAITLTFPIAQATSKASEIIPAYPGAAPDYPVGDYKALVANSNDWLIVDWDTATMGAQPSVSTAYDVWVRPKVISETNPLHIRGHPIDLHQLANTQEGIADDAVSAAATKAALGDLFYELRITEEWEYSAFVEMLKGSAGYGTRYNADGEQEFFPTRYAEPEEVDTVTAADIIGDDRGEPKEVIFRVSEASAIKGVDFKLQQFRLWNSNTDSTSDRPPDGVTAEDLIVTGERRDDSVVGEKIVKFEVPGMIMLSGDGSGVFNQPLALREWIIAAGEVIIDRAGWGWAEGELEVLSTVAGQVGDYLDIEHPAQVNAKTGQDPIGQRGGTRKVQIVSRTELPGTSKLKVKDAGNLAQDPPVAPDDGTGGTDPNDGIPVPDLSLAPSADEPYAIATVTLDNIADFDDLNADTLLQYLVQDATPASTDEGDFFGPLESSTGEDEIDAPAAESGQTIWVRGRATIVATGQLGEWSTWISLTLGPDDDGTGGTLPPFLLALQIDDDGVLSATATSLVAEITDVYFLAGAAGGAAPIYASVLGGTLDSAGPPFTAASLATMAEGEVRTVGAIGEDALGNRTVLVLATITRAVDTGAAAGTPGDFSLLLRAGPALKIVDVPAAVTRHAEGDTDPDCVSLSRSRSVRVKAVVLVAFPSGTKVALQAVRFTGGVWTYLNAAGSGPFVAVDAVSEISGRSVPNLGDWVEIDEEWFEDNVFLDWVTVGGDGASDGVLGNVRADFRTSAAPPASDVPDPELPTDGLVAYWALTEGSGQTVANKSPGVGTADLVLGDNTGDGTRDPTWAASPRRLTTTGFGAGDHHYAHYDSVPSAASGYAIFFYGDITTIGGLTKHLCGLVGGALRDHDIQLVDVGGGVCKAQAHVVDAGSTPRLATGTTTIVNGSKHWYGLVHDGTTLGIYVDPADGLPEGTVACGTAIEDASPRDVIIGAGNYPLTIHGGPDSWAFGDIWLAAGSAVADLTPAKIAEMYAVAKLTYTTLP